MKHTPMYLFLVLIMLMTNCYSNRSLNGQSKESEVDDYTQLIDSLIQTIQPRRFNGVILITQNGEIRYSKAYGYANMEAETPISIQDNFRIQSNSKQITAVLTLRALERGKINLASPIKTYLPDLKSSWGDTVTVHQLLNMSSGIAGLNRPLLFAPGTGYKYSNPAYGLLGRIIENVTGETYVDAAHNLFKELGMNNTYCFELDKGQASNLINGYTDFGDAYEMVDFYARGITKEGWKDFIPAGGIISNAIDLNIWDTKLHSGQLLSPENYELMTNYNITGQHDAFGPQEIGYGYGVRIDDEQAVKVIGHAGRGLGFASIKFFVPEKNLNVIVLENVYHENVSIIYHFESAIREIVLSSSLVK